MSKRNGRILNCLKCNKNIYKNPSQEAKGEGKYCSRECKGMGWDSKGSNNHKWKNGRKIHGHGYILVTSPNHPNKDKQGYVREHRLVMERYLGRYLESFEDVHHLDGNKKNNSIKNLELLESRSLHIKTYHRDGGKRGWFKKGGIYAT